MDMVSHIAKMSDWNPTLKLWAFLFVSTFHSHQWSTILPSSLALQRLTSCCAEQRAGRENATWYPLRSWTNSWSRASNPTSCSPYLRPCGLQAMRSHVFHVISWSFCVISCLPATWHFPHYFRPVAPVRAGSGLSCDSHAFVAQGTLSS